MADHTIEVGDIIRFSAVMLVEMTNEEYPLVRVVEIHRAADGSKEILVTRRDLDVPSSPFAG